MTYLIMSHKLNRDRKWWQGNRDSEARQFSWWWTQAGRGHKGGNRNNIVSLGKALQGISEAGSTTIKIQSGLFYSFLHSFLLLSTQWWFGRHLQEVTSVWLEMCCPWKILIWITSFITSIDKWQLFYVSEWLLAFVHLLIAILTPPALYTPLAVSFTELGIVICLCHCSLRT